MKTSAELPNLVLEAIGAGTWDWDIPADRITCNGAFCRIVGLDPDCEELSAEVMRDLVHPEDRDRVLVSRAGAIEHQSQHASTYRVVRADGTLVWVRDLGRVIQTNVHGQPTRMVGAIRDVTANVELNETLAESERRFADIVEGVPGVVIRYEVDADGTSRHSYISPNAYTVFGITPDGIRADPMALRRMFTAADLDVFEEYYVQRRDRPKAFERRVPITTPDGEKKEVQIYSRPVRRPDGVTWTTTVFDVTEQARIEKELAQSREIILHSQKLEAIGQLSGGIAHDFNNLLSVILGNLELIADEAAAADRDSYVSEAISAARRGSELTSNLLSFARKANLRPRKLDLNEVIRGMHAMIYRTLPENIEVETALMGGLWPAMLDRGSVENALLNLVINARDAMPRGGKLTVETSNIRLTHDYVEERQETIPAGRYVMIAVSDTGVGISPEVLDRVFEPFFTTKAVGRGTGLGLPSALGFSKQSGGTTRIYSEPGVGTAVKMYFRAETSATDYAPPPPDAAEGRHQRILLVEDDLGVRSATKLRLEAAGYAVTEAGTGEEGLKLFLSQGPFAVVITDIVMPGRLMGNGMVREMRKVVPYLRAIFVSGYPSEAAIHGNGLSPDDVQLMKPVAGNDLLRAVEEVLRPKA